VLEEIRATIRRCRHGMLVTTACMLGALACAAWPHGPIVSLQPCSVEQSPSDRPAGLGRSTTSTTYLPCGIGSNKASWTTVHCRTRNARSRTDPTTFVETDDGSQTTRRAPVEIKHPGVQRRRANPTHHWPADRRGTRSCNSGSVQGVCMSMGPPPRYRDSLWRPAQAVMLHVPAHLGDLDSVELPRHSYSSTKTRCAIESCGSKN
jgi:hypothetical protein